MRVSAFIAIAVLALFFIGSGLFLKSGGQPEHGYATIVDRYSSLYGVDSRLVDAVIATESGGRRTAVSSAGAVGLMQLMHPTACMISRKLGIPEPSRKDLMDPDLNIRLGTKYLSDLEAMFNGEQPLVLAAYNAGPGAVRRWVDENPGIPAAEVVSNAAYPETRRYVLKVMKLWGRTKA